MAGAQIALDMMLAVLARNGVSTAEVQNQMQMMAQLQRRIGSANGANLAELHSEIKIAVAMSQAVVERGRDMVDNARASDAAGDLATDMATSREQVMGLVRDLHRFDAFLQFASPEDEQDYRRREDARTADIQRQLALGTPQGTLNASGLMVGQMADAAAHGAADSPEFQQRWDALLTSTARLRADLIRSGKDVSEFDERLREDLRQIMRRKGVPDAQIDALFAANPNPLEAARAFVANTDIESVAASVDQARAAIPPVTATITAAAENPIASGLDSVMANLQSAGVMLTDPTTPSSPDHGLKVAALSPISEGRNV